MPDWEKRVDPSALRGGSSSRPWELSLLVVRVLVYCSCTFFVARRILALVFMGALACVLLCLLNRPWLRKIENATARECLCMTDPGPPLVLPLEYGSGMWRTLRRCCGAFVGWSPVDTTLEERHRRQNQTETYLTS